MCPRGSFPQGLPELSETVDDRVLHITASRSNNCDSHLSERLRLVTDQCRQVVSRLLEQGAAGCVLRYLISFIWLGLEMFHRAVWLKEKKKRSIDFSKDILMQIQFAILPQHFYYHKPQHLTCNISLKLLFIIIVIDSIYLNITQ